MKTVSTTCLFWLFLFTMNAQDTSSPYFTLDPTLTPDATAIIFSHQGDLWQVPVQGGQALRLTAMEGDETRPHVSPDGEWLAFTATRNGNKDIFVMPLQGGPIQQLTFHSAYDDVDGWNWDSENIYFTSDRYNRMSGYTVPLAGGTPVRLFDHYFNTVHNLEEHPISGEIFFNESWESKNFAHRKRYKGDYNPDIKSYNPETAEYRQYTDYEGKDFGVTIDQQGNTYFMSDEDTGEYNLFQLQSNEKVALTSMDTSIFWPQVSANGEKIVFRMGYRIYIYDVASGTVSSPPIQISNDRTLEKEESYTINGKISAFDISPDQKKLVFVSRGVLFVSDVEGKFIRKISTDPAEAVGEVHWLKDNRSLLFSQSNGGYYNWYTLSVDSVSVIRQLTDENQNQRQLTFNSDRTKGVYLSGRNQVRIMDLETLSSETIVEDELWAMYNPNPYFSPDDRYIVYAAKRNFEDDLFVYDTEGDTSLNLTHTKVTETFPFWSPDGKYIYMSSDRLHHSYPYGTSEARIYRLALEKFDSPYRLDKLDELLAAEDESSNEDDGEKNESSDTTETKDEDEQIKIVINEDGLMRRMERISPTFGEQTQPYVVNDGDKSIILYLSNHDGKGLHLWKTTLEPFEDAKTEKISESRMGGYQIREADGKYYLLTGGELYKLDPAKGKMDKISLHKLSFEKTLANEFRQMFHEAWAGFEENFYDSDFHGENWQALRDEYIAYLPMVQERSHLRLLLNDMLGELNTSHFGFYSSGPEDDLYFGDQTLETGLLFEQDDPYRIAKVIERGPADHEGQDIEPGALLVAVDGVEVDPAMNRETYFISPENKEEITLTLEGENGRQDIRIHPVGYGTIRSLLYDAWQDENQQYVDQHSQNRIGYVHMKNMGRGQYNSFVHDMVGDDGYRDGLIVDLRFNTGGNVHDDVLRFLSQRKYLQWKYREGELTGQSNHAPADKPIVLLINEQSLSDAEMTAAGFKALDLGTIVGTETYRWIIFTSGKGLVDGSFYRLPSWGCYTLDGENIEKEGVKPDIRVDEDFEDRLNGNQPQLDKAIELILSQLNN